MTVKERRVDDVTVLELHGRLIYDDGDSELRSKINDLVGQGRLKIVINLRDVSYIDSCGVGVLIGKYVSVRRKGGDLKLLHLSPRSHHVMDICGLLNVFDTFDSEAAAVTSFARQKASDGN
jgi:anti-anti-sigma factor